MSRTAFEVPEITDNGTVELNFGISSDAKARVQKLHPDDREKIVERFVAAFRGLVRTELGT